MNLRAKTAIQQGRAVLAVNPGGVALPAVEALAACGADCLFIDCERTAVSVESIPALARAAQACGMSAVVRVMGKDPAQIIRALDCGVDGIVLPQAESADDCHMLVAAARAATRGREGELLLIAQIESVAAHQRLEAMAAVPGVDLFLIGPNDLAHAMGFLGDTARPELKAAVDDIMARLAALGRPFGLPATTASAPDLVARGATFLYATLEGLLRPGVAALRGAMGAPLSTQ
ncbi:HpcH/HpaI aldolase family protein [Azorhizobium doebereinerae]|uniref:HpcH/HpaI aldolase family protein n=1 Tax=Azorhizobium doebereinerae TaxID=281091 RepID=UPI000424A0AF|nr:aldolase/citrate lyase family protein [Azorhizobium doebereinerae]